MRILIADDSAEICKRLAEMLSDIPGVEIVGFVADGASTLEAVRRLRPDVVTLDLRMPGGSGFDVLRDLRGEPLAPFVIMLTNYASPEYERRATALGAGAFLDKSRDFDRVVELVRERMGQTSAPERTPHLP
jgi:DNA-binding NarL/FixJ family response regulator